MIKRASRSDEFNTGNSIASKVGLREAEADQFDKENSHGTSICSEPLTVDSMPELWSDSEHPEWVGGGHVTVEAKSIEELSDDDSNFLENEEERKLTISNQRLC